MKTQFLVIVTTLAFLASSYAQDYQAIQKQKNQDRAAFWAEKGYTFDSTYMTAYSMDQKVKDIDRARFWKEKGYSFNPDYMTAYSMDQKVKDIDRARFWKEKGYSFNPDYMTAYSMDQKVKDIERAKYWKEKGHNFDSAYMTAYSMDLAVRTGAKSQTKSLATTPYSRPIPATPTVIETQMDGDFEGWEGETIFKLANGQIWQQSEYAFTYTYSYRPDVLIYRSETGGWKMQVEGVERTIGVQRLK
jgi:hypothetical protein